MTEPNEESVDDTLEESSIPPPDPLDDDLVRLEKRVKAVEDFIDEFEDLMIHSGLDLGGLREKWKSRNG